MRDIFVGLSPYAVDPGQWITHVVAAHAAAKSGDVPRQAGDVGRIIGRDQVRAEPQRRGYRRLVNGG